MGMMLTLQGKCSFDKLRDREKAWLLN